MRGSTRILVVQTAFLGDLILCLPLIQALRELYPDGLISVMAIPAASGVLLNHPAVERVIEYDKRGTERGVAGLFRMVRTVRSGRFDISLIPHRSLRSALIPFLAGVPVRVGFNTSAGRMFMSDIVPYRQEVHEINRNLDLGGVAGAVTAFRLPDLYPGDQDVESAERFLAGRPAEAKGRPFITVAPGSVWFTKRWPEEAFAHLLRALGTDGIPVVLVGGKDDRSLADRIMHASGSNLVSNAAGIMSPLGSAELIRKSAVLVTNDSAPMHLAVAMRTRIVALFGATIPSFGFAPPGSEDIILETNGLSCRPCGIHGGHKCPIRSFDCMNRITPLDVRSAVLRAMKTNLA